MSLSTSQITAATAPLNLKDAQGNVIEFAARPFTDLDWAEIDEWIQSRIIAAARKSCKDDPECTPADRKETMAAAMTSCLAVSSFTDEGNDILSTPPGVARMAYQMCKEDEQAKGMTYLDFRAMMQNGNNLEEVFTVFKKINARFTQEGNGQSGNE